MMSDAAAAELPIGDAAVIWANRLPAELPGGKRFGKYLQALPGDALFEFPGIGRFRVREGRRIEIERAQGCTKARAVAFARIVPFGALVHQRGELPLHASSVLRERDYKVLLIAGACGAGKSTAAAALVRRGWKALNDDLSRLTFTGKNVLVWPGYHQLKLWERSCRLLDIDFSHLPQTGELKQKYFWPAPKVEGARPVTAIVELCPSGQPEAAAKRLRGSAAIRMLCEQTYRPLLVYALGRQESHFRQVAHVAGWIPCYRLAAAGHQIPWGDLCDRLEAIVSGDDVPA